MGADWGEVFFWIREIPAHPWLAPGYQQIGIERFFGGCEPLQAARYRVWLPGMRRDGGVGGAKLPSHGRWRKQVASAGEDRWFDHAP